VPDINYYLVSRDLYAQVEVAYCVRREHCSRTKHVPVVYRKVRFSYKIFVEIVWNRKKEER